MAKRFSWREFVLLMAPVLAVGAVGFWVSMRPKQHVENEKSWLEFSAKAPTTLEAFRGANTVFTVKIRSPKAHYLGFIKTSPFLTVTTPHGVEVSRRDHANKRGWRQDLWAHSSDTSDGSRFLLKTAALPLGTLHFGVDVKAQTGIIRGAPPTPLQLGAKWRIDRAQLKALNLAALSRKPLVSLVAVKISGIYSGAGFRTLVMGEAVFRFKGAMMNDKTPFEVKFSGSTGPMGWGSDTQFATTPKLPHQHITQWTVYLPKSPNEKAKITGRISADNRWPLGFEFEPFDFKTAKVGQKLRFKQFPVALPKS